ncbi:MAG: hypothetical protein ACLUFT_12440 [Gemmiger formicilis]
MLKKIAALLLVPVLLAGCSEAGDVETLLRARSSLARVRPCKRR